ncbi:MAG TPA: hypothetical protein VMT85_18445 [Thermoanaerobaculia bacterium]|nr:hypothetical protein [Thermoanaerobaculia bacterium]
MPARRQALLSVRALLLLGLLATGAACARAQPVSEASFNGLLEALSEPAGYFDTDNLISNESSYGQAVELLAPVGGVYVGVGPEQNFHYIARLRPSWAFVVDIRRDNQLHLLLLTAILRRASDPLGYLCLQFSRSSCGELPADGPWPLEQSLRRFEERAPSEQAFEASLAELIETITGELGVSLDDADRAKLRAIHRAFFENQLELRFESHGRRFQSHHPTDRELILARTPGGEPASFLASRDAYEAVRSLALAGRLVPVVGDFGGAHALRAIGELVERLGEQVTAIYVSNVEYYLLGTPAFDRWVGNVRSLPLADDARMIRACFHYGQRHPASLPGHRSTLVVQPAADLLEWASEPRYRSYWELCTRPWLTASGGSSATSAPGSGTAASRGSAAGRPRAARARSRSPSRAGDRAPR